MKSPACAARPFVCPAWPPNNASVVRRMSGLAKEQRPVSQLVVSAAVTAACKSTGIPV